MTTNNSTECDRALAQDDAVAAGGFEIVQQGNEQRDIPDRVHHQQQDYDCRRKRDVNQPVSPE